MKAFADDKIKVPQKLKIDLERIENTVGRDENASVQHFLIFRHVFKDILYKGRVNQGLFGKGLICKKMSAHVGLRSPRTQTSAESFVFSSVFRISKDYLDSRFNCY